MARSTLNLRKPSLTVICARQSKHLFTLLAQPGEKKGEGERHTALYDAIINEHLTISPVAAQCNGACGKRSSIECVHIDRCWPQKSWRWRLRSTLNLDSDKFRCFNYRDELDCTVFLPNFRLVTLLQLPRGPAPCDSDACYI